MNLSQQQAALSCADRCIPSKAHEWKKEAHEPQLMGKTFSLLHYEMLDRVGVAVEVGGGERETFDYGFPSRNHRHVK